MPIKATANGKTFTFPDGTSQENMAAAIDQYFAGSQQPVQAPAPADTSGMTIEQLNALERSQQLQAESERIRQQGAQLGPVEGVVSGIGAGMLDVGRTVGNWMLPGQPFGADQFEQDARARFQAENPVSFGVGEFIGETAATLPLAGMAGGIAGKFAFNTVSKTGAGAKWANTARLAVGGAAEGATVAAQLNEDTGTGAAIGAVANMAMPVVFRAGQKAFQKLTGKTPTAGVFDEATGELTEAAQKELTDAGIPLETFSDEVEQLVKQNFNPEIDLAAQARQAQLQEFAPEAQARPSRLSQDFAAQNAEETLISLGTPEGRNILRAEQGMQEQLAEGARTKLLGDLDSDLIVNFQTITNDANKGLMGATVKESVSELDNIQSQNVSKLYSAARNLAGEGEPLPINDLRLTFDLTLDEYAPTDGAINAVGKALKEFGVIPEGDDLFDAYKLSQARSIKNLTLDNAEELRKRLNKLDPRDGSQDSAFISIMRSKLDQQVDAIIDQFPEGGAAAGAFKDARRASADYKRTFNEKELTGKLIGFKRGTSEAQIAEEKVLDVLMNSNLNSVKNLKRLMIENGTENSRKAWNEIRFTTVDELLRSSMNRQTGEISGQRLSTRMAAIGDERLKLLLGNEKFNQLKRFEKVIKDQTIPIRRLENPSGTAGTLMPMLNAFGDLMKGAANVSTGGVVESVGKTAKNRSIIEKAIKESQSSIGRSARATSIKARQQLADYFKELTTVGIVSGAQNDSN